MKSDHDTGEVELLKHRSTEKKPETFQRCPLVSENKMLHSVETNGQSDFFTT